MNDKITIQELIEFISSNQSTSKKEIEAFAREFFKLIEDALQNERYVKIKGLGTFKLIEVDSRESINVNTGERFEIQGHNKITFTPDTTLKELVNKPFAHFESVVLNDGVFFDEMPTDDDEAPIIE
ncbi:MAG: HU family DNA-binding protein, partial [Bacteroides sp.]|nr:HU family DNA-binding protein [Bacteroides sp.]